jgi:pimeloyl-ACP methyl ester carboxylesterase
MKRVVLLAVALLAVSLLWKGELVFNAILRGWLAVNGVHSEVASPGGGATVFWFEGGRENEQSVILLHGVGGNALSSWFRLLPSLAGRYHVIAPDLFFANMPDLVGSDYNIKSEKALLKFLIYHLDLKHVTILGLSFGAWPAMQAAADLPDVVDGVILVSPFGPDGAGIVEGLRLDAGNPGKDFYYRIFETPPPVPGMFLSTHWERTSRVFEALPKFSGQLKRQGAELARDMKRIACPVLILAGDHDRVLPRQQFDALSEALPRSEVHVLENCGHAVVWDRPGALESEVKAFLQKVEGGR